MEKVKNLQQDYAVYKRSNKVYLSDCYDSNSNSKQEAYNYCRELFKKYNGEDFRIVTFNTFQFTVGFVGTYEGKKAYFHITKSHDRVMIIE